MLGAEDRRSTSPEERAYGADYVSRHGDQLDRLSGD